MYIPNRDFIESWWSMVDILEIAAFSLTFMIGIFVNAKMNYILSISMFILGIFIIALLIKYERYL